MTARATGAANAIKVADYTAELAGQSALLEHDTRDQAMVTFGTRLALRDGRKRMRVDADHPA